MKSFVIILKGHPQSEIYGDAALSTGTMHGWDIQRFDAVDGRKQTFKNFNLFPAKTSNKKLTRVLTMPGVVGCFLSHYTLWKLCLEQNETIGIFEQDVTFNHPFSNNVEFSEVLRLDRPKYDGRDFGTGTWWEGAHAYILKPAGAKKLIDWTHKHGVFPADIALGINVVDIQFNSNKLISLNMESRKHSLTKAEKF